MSSLADDLVARATRLIFSDEPALWTVSAHGRVVGSLVCQGGAWRLASYVGPVDGNVEALAQALSNRLDAPVRVESQSF
jgi:hypothetical protein